MEEVKKDFDPASMTDDELKRERKRLFSKLRKIEAPFSKVDAELKKRCRTVSENFSVGETVFNTIGKNILSGEITFKDTHGALIKREGFEKDVFVPYIYLRKTP